MNKLKCMFLMVAMLMTSPVVQAQSSKKTKQNQVTTGAQDRQYWAELLYKMSSPVILNLADGTLKKNMPVEVPPGQSTDFFKKVTYLEAVGRTMAGVAP